MGEVADRPDDQGIDQAADLVDGQPDQCGIGWVVGFAGGRVGGADRQDGEGYCPRPLRSVFPVQSETRLILSG
jgi:hypothetical protein